MSDLVALDRARRFFQRDDLGDPRRQRPIRHRLGNFCQLVGIGAHLEPDAALAVRYLRQDLGRRRAEDDAIIRQELPRLRQRRATDQIRHEIDSAHDVPKRLAAVVDLAGGTGDMQVASAMVAEDLGEKFAGRIAQSLSNLAVSWTRI